MIRVGTRTSRLARAQADRVAQALADLGHETEIVGTDTLGDRRRKAPVHELGVAGAFTSKLEAALQADEVDVAVHSLKDLPTETAPGLRVAAILERGRPGDVLLVRPEAHDPEASPPVAKGARVATSGPRRQSQITAERGDATIVNVRGNVDTRVAKLREGRFDALVTASVVLDRMTLPLDDLVVHHLDPEGFPPAPGQAAIAVQTREEGPAAQAATRLDHEPSRRAVEAERRLLARLGGGCGLPLGAWVRPDGDEWRLSATFAGHGWDLTCRGRVRRSHATGPQPSSLVDRFADEIADIEPQPRRPPLDQAPEPEGEPVLVVASEPTAREWAALLRRAGRAAEPAPTRTFTPTDEGGGPNLEAVDWIAVTSRQAAAPLARALDGPLEANVAAVGPATARALQGEGLACHLVAPEATGESLAEALAEIADDGRVLLAQGEITHGEAGDRLAKAGLAVDRWQAYRTEEHPLDAGQLDAELPAPAAIVMSPRNARSLADVEPDVARALVAIGPSTATELREAGRDPIVAPAPRPDAVLEVLP